METLLTALQNADRICSLANVHFENAAQLEQQLQTLTARLKKTKTKWTLIGFVLWTLAGTLLGGFARGQFLSLLISVGSIVAGVTVGTRGYRKEKTSLESEIRSHRVSIQAERTQARKILDDNYQALSFLPDDYWYPMATNYLVKAIASRRVQSLGEALDRFDAQLHRWKVEEANANLLAQQQLQTDHLRSIRVSSKVSAAANVTNTVFNIASRL